MFGKKNPSEKPEFEMFNIFDTKVGIYNDPMQAVNHHDMLRQLHSMMSDPQQAENKFVKNSEDFQLFRIGFYSRRSGTLESIAPEHIANLHEIRHAAKNQGVQPAGH